jgi:(p)ppGpp synthase/HD superfamily hydrolase
MSRLICDAAAFAAVAHGLQTRKDLNEAYIAHPLRCGAMAARMGARDEVIAALYLHDVVEDCPNFALEDLKDFPERVVRMVSLLTKLPKSYEEEFGEAKAKQVYYGRILTDPDAVFCKIVDRIDNLRDATRTALGSPTMKRFAARYLAKTLAEFPPLRQALIDKAPAHAGRYRNSLALVEFDQALADLSNAVAKEQA